MEFRLNCKNQWIVRENNWWEFGKEGIKANMEKVAISPVSFILYYNQEVSKGARKEWDSVDVELTVKDDLGNIYSGEGNGEVATILTISIGVPPSKN